MHKLKPPFINAELPLFIQKLLWFCLAVPNQHGVIKSMALSILAKREIQPYSSFTFMTFKRIRRPNEFLKQDWCWQSHQIIRQDRDWVSHDFCSIQITLHASWPTLAACQIRACTSCIAFYVPIIQASGFYHRECFDECYINSLFIANDRFTSGIVDELDGFPKHNFNLHP